MDPRSQAAARFSRATRVPLETVVRLHFEGQVAYQNGFAANVSATGMFVKHPEPHPVGTPLVFEFVVGRSRKPVQGSGEVAWVRPKYVGPGQPAGMGIAFEQLDDKSRENLAEALFEFLEESLGGDGRDVGDLAPGLAPSAASFASSAAPGGGAGELREASGGGAGRAAPNEPFRLGFSAEDDLESMPTPGVLPPPVERPPAPAAPAADAPGATWSLGGDEPESFAPLLPPETPPVEDGKPDSWEPAGGWPHLRSEGVPQPLASRQPRAYNLEEAIVGGERKAAWRGPAIALLAVALLVAGWYFDPLGLRPKGTAPRAEPASTAGSATPGPARETKPADGTAPGAPTPGAPSTETQTAAGAPNGPDTSDGKPPAGAPDAATAPAERAAAATGGEASPGSPIPSPAAAAAVSAAPAAPGSTAPRFRNVRDITWSVVGAATVVVIETDGTIAKGDFAYAPIGGDSPRLLLRLFDVAGPFTRNRIEARSPQLKAIRTGYHAGGRGNEVHVVLDLQRIDPETITVTPEGSRLVLRCGG